MGKIETLTLRRSLSPPPFPQALHPGTTARMKKRTTIADLRTAVRCRMPCALPSAATAPVVVQRPALMEKAPLYEIRGSLVEDQAQILRISRHLNTVNLPEEEEGVHQILEASQKSFTQAVKDPKRRQYVFVLVD